jgi:hypothetical protein
MAEDTGTKPTFKVVWAGLVVAFALPLLAYASVGWYARYVADDYCWAGVLRTHGFLQAQVHWYTLYSPRYAFTFLVNLVEIAGPAIVPFLPAAALGVWLVALTWTLTQLRLRLSSALLLAELVAFATLHTAPDVAQSLYWQTGMLTYLLPLILLTILCGWIAQTLRRQVGPLALGVCTALTFVAGGLSETYLIPQNVGLTLALLVAVAARHRRAALLLGAALLGGVLSLAVIVLAPATTSRVGGEPADLWLSLSAAIATAALQVGRLVRHFPHVVVLCLAAPILLRVPALLPTRRVLLIATGIVAITLPFCYFPSFYASNGNPPARSLIVPGCLLIAYLVCVGASIRINLFESRRLAVAAAVLALVPIAGTLSIVPEHASAAEYAALWDREDHNIRAAREAGHRELIVSPRPRYLGEGFVSTDKGDWFNACVARYYGLDSIAASDAT